MFAFSGLISLDKTSRDSCLRMYREAEHNLGPSAGRTIHGELRAVTLFGRDKSKLFRSLSSVREFTVVVKLDRIRSEIFCDRKTRQHYLDYTFKRALKNALQRLLSSGEIPADYPRAIDVRMDEHTTATDGRYELRESLIQELKTGTFNWNYASFFPLVLSALIDVRLKMRGSKLDPLIHAADIVVNRVYFKTRTNDLPDIRRKVSVLILP